MTKFRGARKFRNEINNFVSGRRRRSQGKFGRVSRVRRERGKAAGGRLKFLAFYANVSTSRGTVPRVAAGLHGGTTLNSETLELHGAVLSALALFLIKTTTSTGKGVAHARAREMRTRKREGERSAEIKKFTRCPGGTRWPRNLKLRKLENRTTG